jgi:hypothetical protein
MEIRTIILNDLENLLNTNAQGIEFIIGQPAVTYNSLFALQRFGDPNNNEKWYEVITTEFTPVVLNGFNAAFVPQPKLRGFSSSVDLMFLIPFQSQADNLQAIEDFVAKLPARSINQNGYFINYNASFPVFNTTEVYNEEKFLQYTVNIFALAVEDSFTLNNMKVELSTSTVNSGAFVEVPILAYTPNRMRETTVVQKVGTNSVKGVAKNSAWVASLNFYLSTNNDDNGLLRNMTSKILSILEDSTVSQNEIFNLRVTYQLDPDNLNTKYITTKEVIITGVNSDFSRDDIASVTINVEEAYFSEVIM